LGKSKSSDLKHKLAQAERRKFVSDVAKLKKAGLVSAKVDPRKQDATDYMKRQIRKYNDVISGKAQSVKIKATKDKSVAQIKKEYSQFKSKGERIVVPVRKGDKVTFSTKRGLGTTRRAYGKLFRVQYIKNLNTPDMAQLKELQSKGYSFSIGFRNHVMGTTTYRYWSNPEEMSRDMAQYNNYKDWQKYIEIVKVVGTYSSDEEDGDGGNGEYDADGNQIY
jgi:hypothetical protein